MAISLKHQVTATGTDAGNGEIGKAQWNQEHVLTASSGTLLGRASAGSGEIEEIACTAAGRALLDDANASAQRATLGLGTLATASTVTNGDITNGAVTYAKIQNVSATNRLLGRSSAGAGVVEEIVCTAAGRALLDDADATAQIATLGLSGSAGSDNIGFLQSGTGAVARTLQSKGRDTISVFDFMTSAQIASVKARDGVEDVSSAIQTAVNSLKPVNGTIPEKGGILYFPAGLYKVGTTIDIYSGILLQGSGMATLIQSAVSLTTQIFRPNSVDVNVQYIYAGVSNMSFVTSGTCWAIKSATVLALNCEFSNLYFYGTYGLSLGQPTYTQNTLISNLVSRGNIEQIFCLTGNFNRVEGINKEGGTGTSTEPYVRLFGDYGFCVNNSLLKILIEGAGNVNKSPIRLENATGTIINDYWNELNVTNGNKLELVSSSAQITGVVAPSAQAYGKIKLTSGSVVSIDELPTNHEDLDWQSYLDISSDSVCYIGTVYGRRGQDVYKIATPENITFGRYINANLVSTPIAGYSAQSFPNYVSGQNLLVNPSFEAGAYGWSISSGDVPTFTTSDVGQGLMFQCTSTTGFQLTQSVTIAANQVGQPVTLRFVAKITGSGFLIPIIGGSGELGQNRIAAGDGWQVMTVTYRPQSSGSLSFGIWWVGLSGSSTLYIDEFGLAFGAQALVNTSKFGSFELNGNTVTYASAAPASGTWKLGDRVFNSSPAVGQPKGWICTVAGSPGTWVSEGNL